MQAHKSPLILEETYIIASNILSVPEPVDFNGQLNDFTIEIDFDIFINEEDSDARRVLVSIQGNDQDKPAVQPVHHLHGPDRVRQNHKYKNLGCNHCHCSTGSFPKRNNRQVGHYIED